MGYTMLKNKVVPKDYPENSLAQAALAFIRDDCEGLRFDKKRATSIDDTKPDFDGTSLKPGQIPYNMEKDIDRLCLENAVDRFLKSGREEDAFDIYFCYLDMFIGDHGKIGRMIELLSELETNNSGQSMKHRDHYSHSVYVFLLGLKVYKSDKVFRHAYKEFYEKAHEEGYDFNDDNQIACHFLKYWGGVSLFHDIGYPFELLFEESGIELTGHPLAYMLAHCNELQYPEGSKSKGYLSDSNFAGLFTFAAVLNGRWNNIDAWRAVKEKNETESFLSDPRRLEELRDSFKDLSLEYKLANINQAKAFARYLDEIGCFCTDKAVDFELVDSFTKDELLVIGRLEHQRWLQEHYDMGWKYMSEEELKKIVKEKSGLSDEEGDEFKKAYKQERELLRCHWDMIPGLADDRFEISYEEAEVNYERLGRAEQDKDTDPMECMLAMLRMFNGLRIYRLR